MSLGLVLWFALGVAAGMAHAAGLWQSTHRRREGAGSAAWRIPVVVGVLAAAAIAGRLLPAAGGWACGLAGASARLLVRSVR